MHAIPKNHQFSHNLQCSSNNALHAVPNILPLRIEIALESPLALLLDRLLRSLHHIRRSQDAANLRKQHVIRRQIDVIHLHVVKVLAVVVASDHRAWRQRQTALRATAKVKMRHWT